MIGLNPDRLPLLSVEGTPPETALFYSLISSILSIECSKEDQPRTKPVSAVCKYLVKEIRRGGACLRPLLSLSPHRGGGGRGLSRAQLRGEVEGSRHNHK